MDAKRLLEAVRAALAVDGALLCAAARRLPVARAGGGEGRRLLDKAWGLEANSRLSCQAKVAGADLTLEIPKYTINYEREGGGNK